LFPAGLTSLVKYLRVRPGAYLGEGHLKSALLRYAPALLENIRVGKKGLPRTNALAYYKKFLNIMVVKKLGKLG
jgi:hypothetical protein